MRLASAPRPLVVGLLTVGLILLALTLIGCDGDDGVRPAREPVLRGRIVDGEGTPVEGVVLSPLYRFDPPIFRSSASRSTSTVVARGPSTTVPYHLSSTGQVLLTVEDALGRTLATLQEGVQEPGAHVAVWDGRRDDGTLVPNGLYCFHLQFTPTEEGEPMDARNEFLLLVVDVAALADRPLAVTDAEGRFSVPMALIPVGYEVITTDEQGNPAGASQVAPDFTLHAFRFEGETLVGRWGIEVQVLDPTRSRVLEVTAPS